MQSRIFIFTNLLWVWLSLSGQSTSVNGSGPGYSGQALFTTIAWNPFITVYEYSNRVLCGEDGSFELEIPLESPRVVQFETGMYQAYLYMEPGYHYRVHFPEYREKTRDARISPFYQPVVIPLQVSSRTSLTTGEEMPGEEEINRSIAAFDSRFAELNEGIILQRRKGLSSQTDSIIEKLESEFRTDTTRFFSSYRRFRYGVLTLNDWEARCVRELPKGLFVLELSGNARLRPEDIEPQLSKDRRRAHAGTKHEDSGRRPSSELFFGF